VAREAVAGMKWLWRRLRTPRPKERNRVASLQAVRQHQDLSYDYGDIELNKQRAATLRKQAQERGDG